MRVRKLWSVLLLVAVMTSTICFLSLSKKILVFGPESPSTFSLVFWSNDYHISPINDLKHLIGPLNVTFIDKSLSGHCHVTNTCQGRSTLRVINTGNAMNMAPSLIDNFYEAYKNDSEIKRVDAFVCFHPAAMCELFERFNSSLIIIASTRYELGRFGAARWTAWNNNLIRYANNPRNVIGGNNLYDVEYIKYFTGIQPVLLPSFCDYIGIAYNQTRPGFLVAPIHHSGLKTKFFQEHKAACMEINCTTRVDLIRSIYPHYKYSDLTAHQGIIYVPYQVSVMSFFEQYRMNIPMICPSLSLLAEWQHKHMVMTERTWDGTYGRRPNGSAIAAHHSQKHIPDPNNEQSYDAIKYWIKFADFYQMPHVMYYDSVRDLVHRLETITQAELWNISQSMKEYNRSVKQKLLMQWKSILSTVAKYRSNQQGTASEYSTDMLRRRTDVSLTSHLR